MLKNLIEPQILVIFWRKTSFGLKSINAGMITVAEFLIQRMVTGRAVKRAFVSALDRWVNIQSLSGYVLQTLRLPCPPPVDSQ